MCTCQDILMTILCLKITFNSFLEQWIIPKLDRSLTKYGFGPANAVRIYLNKEFLAAWLIHFVSYSSMSGNSCNFMSYPWLRYFYFSIFQIPCKVTSSLISKEYRIFFTFLWLIINTNHSNVRFHKRWQSSCTNVKWHSIWTSNPEKISNKVP